jgi:8-oxo-dGTP pyrophosphatase MutT (NUDIX family)
MESNNAGVVAVVPEGGCLLVIRRSRHVIAPGKICFPGGGIRPGESERDALRREMREELGIPIAPIRRLWTSVTPWQVPLAWWLVRRTGTLALRPDPREVESVHWMRPERIAELPDLLESNSQFLAAWRREEFDLQLGEGNADEEDPDA